MGLPRVGFRRRFASRALWGHSPDYDQLVALRAQLFPADPEETRRVARLIDEDLDDPDAAQFLRQFYDPSSNYAGATYLDLGKNDPNNIIEDDLLAVTLLEVRFHPRSVRRLLDRNSPARRAVLDQLKAVPPGVELGPADIKTVDLAWQFCRSVHDLLGGSQWVAIGKLCARKRPALIPIQDSVMNDRLDLRHGGFWLTTRALLDDQRRARLRQLALDADPSGSLGLAGIPTLRLLDTVVWMRHSKGAEPTRRRLRSSS